MNREHHNKYAAMCKKHGVAWDEKSPRLVGETLASITAKHAKDEHLNNVPLTRWDTLAHSFLSYNRHAGLSLAEAVCMQKHAARILIESQPQEATR